MKRWHTIWLLASFALSFGANHTLKPKLDYAAFGEGHTLPTGEIIFSGDAHVPIVDIRVVAADATTPIGRTVPVRVLLMRGALGDGQLEPDLELFIDLASPDGALIDPGARNIDLLRGRPLAVLPIANGSDVPSRVRLPGSEGAAIVQRGSFTITDALQISPGDWRIRGDLDVELMDAGSPRAAMARIVAKLIWE